MCFNSGLRVTKNAYYSIITYAKQLLTVPLSDENEKLDIIECDKQNKTENPFSLQDDEQKNW